MATENQLRNTPIRLSCDCSRPIGLNRSRNSVVVACNHKNTILTTGLFLSPQTLRGRKGVLCFLTSGVNTSSKKNAMSDGVFVITSDASLFKRMSALAESSVVFLSSASLVEYLTLECLDDVSFRFIGKKAETKHLFALHGDDGAFAFDADVASATMEKLAESTDMICISGIAYANKIIYASSSGNFSISGVADMTIVGYEDFSPSDYESIIDADGEEFITIRSDDNGV